MLIIPVMPNKEEAWRRFMQELEGSQSEAFKSWCVQLNLHVEQVWLNEASGGTAVIVNLTISNSEVVLEQLAQISTPFDRWFRQQILTLHGLDLTKINQGSTHVYFGEQFQTQRRHSDVLKNDAETQATNQIL